MAISFTEYDTNTAPIGVIDRGQNLATMAVAFENFWNRDEVIEALGDEVLDFIEDLFCDVSDQYATMALYEMGELWDCCAWVDADDSAEILGATILSTIDSGGSEADRYIEGQAKAVAMVREFVSHAQH